jgi:hypothetical protein
VKTCTGCEQAKPDTEFALDRRPGRDRVALYLNAEVATGFIEAVIAHLSTSEAA